MPLDILTWVGLLRTVRRAYSLIVQLVERWTVNPYVAGSSPAQGAIQRKRRILKECPPFLFYSSSGRNVDSSAVVQFLIGL